MNTSSTHTFNLRYTFKVACIVILSTVLVLAILWGIKLKDSFIPLSAKEKTELKDKVLHNKVTLFKCAPLLLKNDKPTVRDIDVKLTSLYLTENVLTVQDKNNMDKVLEQCQQYNAEHYKNTLSAKIVNFHDKVSTEITKELTHSDLIQ